MSAVFANRAPQVGDGLQVLLAKMVIVKQTGVSRSGAADLSPTTTASVARPPAPGHRPHGSKRTIRAFLLCLVAVSAFGAGSPYVPMYPDGSVPNALKLTNQLNTFMGTYTGNAVGLTNMTSVASFNGTFFASDFGLKGDTRLLTDIGTVSGSATITSARGEFLPSDVGKIVIIYTNWTINMAPSSNWAGVWLNTNNMQHLYTTVVSVTTAFSEVLASPVLFSTGSPTNRMWIGTDDAPAFRNMVNSMPKGGDIELGGKIYMMGSFSQLAGQQVIIPLQTNSAATGPIVYNINGRGAPGLIGINEFPPAANNNSNNTLIVIGVSGVGLGVGNTNPALFSANAPQGSPRQSLTILNLDKIGFLQMPNPSVDVIGFENSGGYNVNQCSLGTDYSGDTLSNCTNMIPFRTNACAIRSPLPPSNDYSKVHDSWIWGYGVGVLTCDHEQLFGTTILDCDQAIMINARADGNGAADCAAYSLHLMNNGIAMDGAQFANFGYDAYGITFEANYWDIGNVGGYIGTHNSQVALRNNPVSNGIPIKIFSDNYNKVLYSSTTVVSNTTIVPGSTGKAGVDYTVYGQYNPYITPLASFTDVDSSAAESALRLTGGVTNVGVIIDFSMAHFPLDTGLDDWFFGEGIYGGGQHPGSNAAMFMWDNVTGHEPFYVLTNSPNRAFSISPGSNYMNNNLVIGPTNTIAGNGAGLTNLFNTYSNDLKQLTPEGFGAVGDGVHNDYAACQACESLVESNINQGLNYQSVYHARYNLFGNTLLLTNKFNILGQAGSWSDISPSPFLPTFISSAKQCIKYNVTNTLVVGPSMQWISCVSSNAFNGNIIPAAGTGGISIAATNTGISDLYMSHCSAIGFDKGFGVTNINDSTLEYIYFQSCTNGLVVGAQGFGSWGHGQGCVLSTIRGNCYGTQIIVDSSFPGSSGSFRMYDWDVSGGALQTNQNVVVLKGINGTMANPNIEGSGIVSPYHVCYLDNSKIRIDGGLMNQGNNQPCFLLTNNSQVNVTGTTPLCSDTNGVVFVFTNCTPGLSTYAGNSSVKGTNQGTGTIVNVSALSDSTYHKLIGVTADTSYGPITIGTQDAATVSSIFSFTNSGSSGNLVLTSPNDNFYFYNGAATLVQFSDSQVQLNGAIPSVVSSGGSGPGVYFYSNNAAANYSLLLLPTGAYMMTNGIPKRIAIGP